jgi:hypothetical protein
MPNLQPAIYNPGGPEGIRTPDLLSAIEARSQLRYRPDYRANGILTDAGVDVKNGCRGFRWKMGRIGSSEKIMAETGSRPVYRITDQHVNERPRERLAPAGIIQCRTAGVPVEGRGAAEVVVGDDQAGERLDMDALDHLVIGQGRRVSLKERGSRFA